jgi:DNA-binding GntR family transcriptional regulator
MGPLSESIVDRVYSEVKAKVVSYALRPGERVNEGNLSRELGVSRTPLREALNRLGSEGLLRLESGRGFFIREFDAKEIHDLFEFRRLLEGAAIRCAIDRADDKAIDALARFLDDTAFEALERNLDELVRLDEIFHERLAEMSGNAEMVKVLRNINARIRFVRWTDIGKYGGRTTHKEHRKILRALRKRDPACVELLEAHISKRPEEINNTIKERMMELFAHGK